MMIVELPPARISLPRSVLETVALELLQKYPLCREATSVTIRRIPASEDGANWTIDGFDPGRAIGDDCGEAIALLTSLMQKHYRLAEDA